MIRDGQNLIRYHPDRTVPPAAVRPGLGLFGPQDDLDRLCHDPVLKLAVWDRYGEETASREATEQSADAVAADRHVGAHYRGNREAPRLYVLGDRLRAPGPGHGTPTSPHPPSHDRHRQFSDRSLWKQEGGAYNGYHKAVTFYHPLVASLCVGGDYDSDKVGLRLGNGFLHAILRQGNVHTANGIRRFLRNVISLRSAELALVSFLTCGSTRDLPKVLRAGRLDRRKTCVLSGV